MPKEVASDSRTVAAAVPVVVELLAVLIPAVVEQRADLEESVDVSDGVEVAEDVDAPMDDLVVVEVDVQDAAEKEDVQDVAEEEDMEGAAVDVSDVGVPDDTVPAEVTELVEFHPRRGERARKASRVRSDPEFVYPMRRNVGGRASRRRGGGGKEHVVGGAKRKTGRIGLRRGVIAEPTGGAAAEKLPVEDVDRRRGIG